MPGGASFHWRAALETLDLDVLQLIIELVLEFEQLHGRAMTPHELRAALTGDLGTGSAA